MSAPYASEASKAPAEASKPPADNPGRPLDNDGTTLPAPSPLAPEHEDRAMARKFTVRCAWDEAAGVFFVHDSPVPGLATEAPTMPALLCKLPGMIRDLLGLEDGAYIDIYVERVNR
ncbi:hypothetical protein Y590_02360 [Methylobacterium sp. AMS5]|nr:hypothetical protein Y590_02360 [Methylobacterium sp. AMS5]